MVNLILRLMALRHDRRAVTALEYGLIAGAVVAVGLGGFSLIGRNLAIKFNAVGALLT